MHLWIVLAVFVGIAIVLTSLEAARRAVVGARMERSIGTLRPPSLVSVTESRQTRTPGSTRSSGRAPEFDRTVRRAS